jgi:hypothetical protein
MNIFVVDSHPRLAAQQLPDKHIVKMPLEMCQMVSIIYSKWYHNWGEVYKADRTPYDTKKGAFRNHPCTIWLSKSHKNLAWGIAHGLALTTEYTFRYGKIHSCTKTLFEAKKLFHKKVGKSILMYSMVEDFVRAMPDELKYNKSIDTFTAYKSYIKSKSWVASNYLRVPERKPEWV